MLRQTRRPDQWIVIDDGKTPMKPYAEMEYVRREPKTTDPKFTLGVNLAAAIPLIRGNKVLIMEDDEWYGARYVEIMTDKLNQAEVVGIGCSKYYHIGVGKYIKHNNMDHASLAQTGFRSSFINEFISFLEGNPFIDLRIWKAIGKRGLIFTDHDIESLYCGIKGLPGRTGIGSGHNPKVSGYLPDPGGTIFRSWVKDHEVYQGIQGGLKS
jgi:glycosyltransferase involved in cell wall biosynthesis